MFKLPIIIKEDICIFKRGLLDTFLCNWHALVYDRIVSSWCALLFLSPLKLQYLNLEIYFSLHEEGKKSSTDSFKLLLESDSITDNMDIINGVMNLSSWVYFAIFSSPTLFLPLTLYYLITVLLSQANYSHAASWLSSKFDLLEIIMDNSII